MLRQHANSEVCAKMNAGFIFTGWKRAVVGFNMIFVKTQKGGPACSCCVFKHEASHSSSVTPGCVRYGLCPRRASLIIPLLISVSKLSTLTDYSIEIVVSVQGGCDWMIFRHQHSDRTQRWLLCFGLQRAFRCIRRRKKISTLSKRRRRVA